MQLKFTYFFAILVIIGSVCRAHKAPTTEEGSFDLSVGVRMKRDEGNSSALHKRTEPFSTTELLLTRDPQTGKLIWPPNFKEAVAIAKRDVRLAVRDSVHKRAQSVRRAMRVMITWYNGHDLLNPSCFPDSANWAPSDDSMVAAVTIDWPGKPKCGSFVKIHHHSDHQRHIIVRIVDSCGGCAPGSPHIDLTLAAFQKLYDRDVGTVSNLRATIVSSPITNTHWSPKVVGLYGPRKTL